MSMRRGTSRSEADPDSLREIVASLLSGMSLARVPADLHSQLLVPLSAAKNEAIVAGNTTAVKRLQSLMHDLRLNPGKSGSSSRASSRAESAFVTTRSLREERNDDLHATITELLDGRALDTLEGGILPQLIRVLKDRKQAALGCGDYAQSQALENLIQEANSRNLETTYQQMQNTRLTNLRVQLLKAKEDMDAAEEFWRQAKEQHEAEYAGNLEAMEEQHRSQLADFDSSFPETLPANFKKVSSTVLQLREQERHLVLSKRYEDAIQFRERADRLEERELKTQRDKFMVAFQAQRQQLVDSQNTQRSCFEKNWARKLERFEREKDHEMAVLGRTVANFEKKITDVEGDTEVATTGATLTPRGVSRASVLTRAAPKASPAAINPRVRNVAATRIAQKKVTVKRV
jgi:tetratricopeptide (TPR) repeat protein